MILIADKNLNKFGYPVFPIKGREIKHPYTASYENRNFNCTAGYMKPENWMIMDILGTYIYHKAYNSSGDAINYGKKTLSMHNPRVQHTSKQGLHRDILNMLLNASLSSNDGIINPDYYKSLASNRFREYTLRPILSGKIVEGVLKNIYPFLKKYSSIQFQDIIRNTANCKIGMTYPVRYYDGMEYINIKYDNYNCPCSFFTLDRINITKTSSNGNVLERSYELTFNTYLGYFFIQNAVSSLYTDLLPDKFYSLSDYAQLYYRLLILPYFGKVKNPIRMDEIRHRLDLKTSDTSMLRKTIKRILDELKEESFIRNFEESDKYGQYMYGYEKTPWKEIEK
jgi:hypothetical protein